MALQAAGRHTCERNFGHCIISWKIKNFSLAICNSRTDICTEEFAVTSLIETRWKLGFRVESDGNSLYIFLKRIGGEPGESFKVSWKITILNGKDEETFVSENKTFIHNDSEEKVADICPLDILGTLPADKSDEVNIRFQMIVLMNTPMYIPTPKDDAITALIDDMKIIAKEGFLHDVVVMLNGKSMKSHKAVLCPRSERVSSSTGPNSKKIQLFLTDTEAANCMFAYLYTGDLKFIFDSPSISVYNYIVHLDIKELRNAYPQEKISMETEAEATNFEYRWTIRDFNCSSIDDLQESEIFEAEGSGVKWQLRIYPKGLTGSTEIQRKYIYIEALAVSSERPRDVYVNFIAKNDKDMITVAKRTYGKISSGTKLGVFFMRIGSASMAKSVVDNVFHIIFSVHTATGNIRSTITNTEPPVPFSLTNYDTYRILSDYVGHLQSDPTFSDLTLLVEGQEIQAHKFLVAGRSATFSRMVEGMKSGNKVLPVHNVRKHVFRVFLDYLYRAVLTDIELGVLVHLHDVAVHYQVKSLPPICLKHLAKQITPENCCYLLMFADERRSAPLKTHTLQYLSAYRELIIDNNGWRRMEEKNPDLFCEVVYFLDNGNAVLEHNAEKSERISEL